MKTFKRPQFAAILTAHAAGQVVTWKNPGYVLKGPPDNLLVIFTANGNAAGLFHRDEETSSYDPADFTITPPVQTPAPDTLRQLVIESLLKDIAANRCEFGEALQDPAPPYALPDWVPLTADGWIDARRITREDLETLTDKQLLAMFDGNACLRYR